MLLDICVQKKKVMSCAGFAGSQLASHMKVELWSVSCEFCAEELYGMVDSYIIHPNFMTWHISSSSKELTKFNKKINIRLFTSTSHQSSTREDPDVSFMRRYLLYIQERDFFDSRECIDSNYRAMRRKNVWERRSFCLWLLVLYPKGGQMAECS